VADHEFYYDPGEIHDTPANRDLARAARRIREAGAAYLTVDAGEMTREQAEQRYLDRAVPPSMARRYQVKLVFGTNKYAGGFFGKGVPALVVLEDGRPTDVYPHREQDGTIVTINDYLDRQQHAGEPGGGELVARMDALRTTIGPVGARARDLIDEGRRR
jgi:hypothetical protein